MKSNYWFCEKIDYFLEDVNVSIATYTCLKNETLVYNSIVDGVTLILVKTTNGYECSCRSSEFSGKLCDTVKRREEMYR